jgi:glutamyl-tRNA reductase
LARSLAGGREAAVLVTCSRTEVYLTGADAEPAARRALAELGGLTLRSPSVYSHEGEDAARHLFRVAAGLESIVPGDTHVTAQVRQAHQMARDAGTTGPLLDRLFEGASAASKRIHTRTSISSGTTSIPAAAIAIAAHIAGPLAPRRVLIVGAGKIAQVAAVDAWLRGCRDITVANRTVGRAEKLASRVGGRAVALDELPTELATADVVLSATASRRFVLTEAHLDAARPIVVFDLAVPADVHPAFASVCRLVDLDGLARLLSASAVDRGADLERAAQIADEEAARYESWRCARTVVPAIRALRHLADEVRREVVDRHAAELASLGSTERQLVETVASELVGKLLHHSTVQLRQTATGNSATTAPSSLPGNHTSSTSDHHDTGSPVRTTSPRLGSARVLNARHCS